MKKILAVIVSFVFIFIVAKPVMAAPLPKEAKMSLETSALQVRVGETVTLTATTLKEGSSYIDSWDGAVKVSTILNNEGNYISSATFSATAPGAYTITYNIKMTAGRSGVTFEGNKTVTITVVNPAVIVGAKVDNVLAIPVTNPKGNITGYDATGDLYAVYSDNTEEYIDTISFHFSSTQTTRNISVEIEEVTYVVSVTRE